jgi:hypothetical protein
MLRDSNTNLSKDLRNKTFHKFFFSGLTYTIKWKNAIVKKPMKRCNIKKIPYELFIEIG